MSKTKHLKILSGQELASYIKERQAFELRQLLGTKNKTPHLVIFYDNTSPVIRKYIDLKKAYGADIGVKVTDIFLEPVNFTKNLSAKSSIVKTSTSSGLLSSPTLNQLKKASTDPSVDAIIVQLPLKHISEDILLEITTQKDVDGLNGGFDSATAEAINWLLGGHNIDLKSKKIAIVGQGRLVGAPLTRMWRNSNFNLTTFDRGDDLSSLKNFDLIVSATGVPALIKNAMLRPGAILIDAGTASEDGVIKGDASPELYSRNDISITPKIGGVGPLTVAALFDHVIRASR